MFERWNDHPAEWWEFWRPQSGYSGGAIIGAAMFVGGFLIAGLLDR